MKTMVVNKKTRKRRIVQSLVEVLNTLKSSNSQLSTFRKNFDEWSKNTSTNLKSIEQFKSGIFEALKPTRFIKLMTTAILSLCILEHIKTRNATYIILGFGFYLLLLAMNIASLAVASYYTSPGSYILNLIEYFKTINDLIYSFNLKLNILKSKYGTYIVRNSTYMTKKYGLDYRIQLKRNLLVSFYEIYGIPLAIILYTICYNIQYDIAIILESFVFYLALFTSVYRDMKLFSFIQQMSARKKQIIMRTKHFRFWFENKCEFRHVPQDSEIKNNVLTSFHLENPELLTREKDFSFAILILLFKTALHDHLTNDELDKIIVYFLYEESFELNDDIKYDNSQTVAYDEVLQRRVELRIVSEDSASSKIPDSTSVTKSHDNEVVAFNNFKETESDTLAMKKDTESPSLKTCSKEFICHNSGLKENFENTDNVDKVLSGTLIKCPYEKSVLSCSAEKSKWNSKFNTDKNDSNVSSDHKEHVKNMNSDSKSQIEQEKSHISDKNVENQEKGNEEIVRMENDNQILEGTPNEINTNKHESEIPSNNIENVNNDSKSAVNKTEYLISNSSVQNMKNNEKTTITENTNQIIKIMPNKINSDQYETTIPYNNDENTDVSKSYLIGAENTIENNIIATESKNILINSLCTEILNKAFEDISNTTQGSFNDKTAVMYKIMNEFFAGKGSENDVSQIWSFNNNLKNFYTNISGDIFESSNSNYEPGREITYQSDFNSNVGYPSIDNHQNDENIYEPKSKIDFEECFPGSDIQHSAIQNVFENLDVTESKLNPFCEEEMLKLLNDMSDLSVTDTKNQIYIDSNITPNPSKGGVKNSVATEISQSTPQVSHVIPDIENHFIEVNKSSQTSHAEIYDDKMNSGICTSVLNVSNVANNVVDNSDGLNRIFLFKGNDSLTQITTCESMNNAKIVCHPKSRGKRYLQHKENSSTASALQEESRQKESTMLKLNQRNSDMLNDSVSSKTDSTFGMDMYVTGNNSEKKILSKNKTNCGGNSNNNGGNSHNISDDLEMQKNIILKKSGEGYVELQTANEKLSGDYSPHSLSMQQRKIAKGRRLVTKSQSFIVGNESNREHISIDKLRRYYELKKTSPSKENAISSVNEAKILTADQCPVEVVDNQTALTEFTPSKENAISSVNEAKILTADQCPVEVVDNQTALSEFSPSKEYHYHYSNTENDGISMTESDKITDWNVKQFHGKKELFNIGVGSSPRIDDKRSPNKIRKLKFENNETVDSEGEEQFTQNQTKPNWPNFNKKVFWGLSTEMKSKYCWVFDKCRTDIKRENISPKREDHSYGREKYLCKIRAAERRQWNYVIRRLCLVHDEGGNGDSERISGNADIISSESRDKNDEIHTEGNQIAKEYPIPDFRGSLQSEETNELAANYLSDEWRMIGTSEDSSNFRFHRSTSSSSNSSNEMSSQSPHSRSYDDGKFKSSVNSIVKIQESNVNAMKEIEVQRNKEYGNIAWRSDINVEDISSSEEYDGKKNFILQEASEENYHHPDQNKTIKYQLKYENIDLNFQDSSPCVTVRLVSDKENVNSAPIKWVKQIKSSRSSSCSTVDEVLLSPSVSLCSGCSYAKRISVDVDGLKMSAKNAEFSTAVNSTSLPVTNENVSDNLQDHHYQISSDAPKNYNTASVEVEETEAVDDNPQVLDTIKQNDPDDTVSGDCVTEQHISSDAADLNDNDFHFETDKLKLNYSPNSNSGSIEVSFRQRDGQTKLVFKSEEKKLYVKTSP